MAEQYKSKELEQMKKLYLDGNSVRNISKITNHSDHKSISRRLKEMGIKVLEQPCKKLDMSDNKIISIYNDGKSIQNIAKELKVSHGLIKRLLLRNNINIRQDVLNRKDIEDKKDEIIKLYNNGENIQKIARLMECDHCVIKRILKDSNINIRPQKFYMRGKAPANKIYLPDKEIIDLYKNNKTILEIAKSMNCDFSVIKRILTENNIETRPIYFYTKGSISTRRGKKYEEIYGNNANEIREKVRLGTIEIMKNPEHRKRLGEIRKKGYEEGRIKKFIGEEHYNWQNGKSFEPYPITFTKEFKNLVRLRDNFCCLNCGISEQKQIVILGRKLSIHHIDHDKENTCLVNCCTLCVSCNTLANRNRIEWQEYYQEKMAKLYNYKYELLEVIN